MTEEFVPKTLHEEFDRRIAAEFNRINHRLSEVEAAVGALHKLTVSVEKLAVNMESMLRELEAQGKRLAALEGQDAEKWRKAVWYFITAALGAVAGVLFRHLK